MYRSIVLTLSCLAASGCGQSELPPPEPVFPVSGVITYQGKPVVGADITFFNPERKRSAFGRTNADGEYQLTTFTMNDGAVAGKSLLSIVKMPPPAPATTEAPIESEAYVPPAVGVPERASKKKKEDQLLPAQYASMDTSGLMAIVTEGQANEFDFELK